ncbi:MAG TPA: hypothetical protein VMO47_04590 [Rhodothermales bacterium]|nr:hypothetical protein [Rhodothermales bacterium]
METFLTGRSVSTLSEFEAGDYNLAHDYAPLASDTDDHRRAFESGRVDF